MSNYFKVKKNDMKIILTIHHFPPNYSAGAELYTFRLARWLLMQGYQTEVVCVESINQGNSNDLDHTHEIYDGISVWRLHLKTRHSGNSFRQTYDNALITDWFTKFLKRTNPHLVHINSCYLLSVGTILAAKELALPTVVTLHDFWFVCPRITLLKPSGDLCNVPDNPEECAWCLATEKRRFRLPEGITFGVAGALARKILTVPAGARLLSICPDRVEIASRRQVVMNALGRADLILAPSKFLKNIFTKAGLNSARLLYSRIGLDTKHWIVPTGLGKIGAEEMRIGYIGQLAPHKGVHLLIKAFNRVKFNQRSATLKIYGDPKPFPNYARLLRKAARGNPRVEFLGRFNNCNVASILDNIDVTVTPSIWYENSPIAIMESLTLGTPVVTTNLGGMPELVEHNANGLLFKVGNVQDLAKQLQRLLNEPDLLNNLAKNANPVRMIDDEMKQITALYEELIANNHS